ncbi:MAG: ATP-binding protein [Candidatus Omnitrophota bacterium]
MTIDARLPSDVELVPGAIKGWLKQLGPLKLNEDAVFGLQLCLQEALINAIRHGHQDNKALTVHCSIVADPQQIMIEVADQGKGFDVNAVPDPTAAENIGKGHGRGIYLIRQTMDEVAFLNGGRTIRMVMKLKGGRTGGH